MGNYYHYSSIFGTNKYINNSYFIHPNLTLKNLNHLPKNKILIQTIKEVLYTFPTTNLLNTKIFLLLDYSDNQTDFKFQNEVVDILCNNFDFISIKYHPRETNYYIKNKACIIIKQEIQSELLIKELLSKEIMVIGFNTAFIYVSNLLGLQTLSLSLLQLKSISSLTEFYKFIGVKLINSIEELKKEILI